MVDVVALQHLTFGHILKDANVQNANYFYKNLAQKHLAVAAAQW